MTLLFKSISQFSLYLAPIQHLFRLDIISIHHGDMLVVPFRKKSTGQYSDCTICLLSITKTIIQLYNTLTHHLFVTIIILKIVKKVCIFTPFNHLAVRTNMMYYGYWWYL